MRSKSGRVLVVAGSDSGGGAGVQADLKTITVLGGFGSSAITALTAQSTVGVFGVLAVPPAFVEQQMRVVLEDLGADVVKIGMLGTVEVVRVVASVLRSLDPRPLVVLDPVLVAKGGARLLEPDAEVALLELLSLATLATPNAPEAEALTGLTVRTPAEARAAGAKLLARGARAVLVKGGHLEGPEVVDVLVGPGSVLELRGPRIESRSTHGTGCTLASAIAVSLSQGLTLEDAVRRARAYVEGAIRSAWGLGRGHGPLDHGHLLRGPR